MEKYNDPNKKQTTTGENYVDERSPEPLTRIEKDKDPAGEPETMPVVNEEEQNRIVNPTDESFRDNPANSFLDSLKGGDDDDDDDDEQDEEIIDPDGGSEIEIPHQPEGDDADDVKRKLPTMAV